MYPLNKSIVIKDCFVKCITLLFHRLETYHLYQKKTNIHLQIQTTIITLTFILYTYNSTISLIIILLSFYYSIILLLGLLLHITEEYSFCFQP